MIAILSYASRSLNLFRKVSPSKRIWTMQENIDHVYHRVQTASENIEVGLANHGYVVIDNFLGSFAKQGLDIEVCARYRLEAERIYNRGGMQVSQSTRWDNDKGEIVSYNKTNVFAAQLNGGDEYNLSPRLHEYIFAVSQSLTFITEKFPEAQLNMNLASNKLAVCIGGGSFYEKHYDNSGQDDLRKLTILLYLNPNWQPSHGGYFRLYLPDNYAEQELPEDIRIDDEGFYYKDIAPINDRLLMFWSDKTVHSVLPSHVFNNNSADHRYALTVWMASKSNSAICIDDANVVKHFSKDNK